MLYQKGHMILNPCIAVKCLASNLANPIGWGVKPGMSTQQSWQWPQISHTDDNVKPQPVRQ